MTAVLECAALAPSVHNTQPWRFDVDGDTIEVRAERDRQLSYLDPTGRQLHVSCGAAIEFAFLAARSIGRECTVRLLPEGGDPDLLASIQLGPARVPTTTERLLAEAIPVRYTDRGPYTDRTVPADLVEDIRARAADFDVWIRTVDDAEGRRALITVLSDAEHAEAADARYGEELARWTGTDGDVGVPADAIAGRWPSDRVSHVPLRDFTGHASHPSVEGRGDAAPPSVERDLLLMLGTPYDDPRAWLTAGRALGWAAARGGGRCLGTAARSGDRPAAGAVRAAARVRARRLPAVRRTDGVRDRPAADTTAPRRTRLSQSGYDGSIRATNAAAWVRRSMPSFVSRFDT